MVETKSSKRNKTLFRELRDALVEVRKNLEVYKNDDKYRLLEQEKLDALEEIYAYVFACHWLTHKSAKEKVQDFLKSDLNYQKTADKHGVKLNAMQVSISSSNKIIRAKVGNTTIEKILEGYVSPAMVHFRVSTAKLNIMSLVSKDLVGMLPDADLDIAITASDCKKELSLLELFSYARINRLIGQVDDKKLSFLRYILESEDEDYTYERQLILNFLEGDKIVHDAGERQLDALMRLLKLEKPF